MLVGRRCAPPSPPRTVALKRSKAGFENRNSQARRLCHYPKCCRHPAGRTILKTSNKEHRTPNAEIVEQASRLPGRARSASRLWGARPPSGAVSRALATHREAWWYNDEIQMTNDEANPKSQGKALVTRMGNSDWVILWSFVIRISSLPNTCLTVGREGAANGARGRARSPKPKVKCKMKNEKVGFPFSCEPRKKTKN